ncbi:vomeronasal type-2 receptor 26-like [Protopterus annectens]|uniref:vomeronasal type-2 receptor 26-like n=1 Tax=Protopterus annectens TaxID=7888 RepID=UPI001CFA3A77|nr:vomeronasal type-2 receptor 26-like [Protopterus annectens]
MNADFKVLPFGLGECIQCFEELWPDDKQEKCIPKIIDFLSFENSFGILLTALSVTTSILTLSILSIFVKFQNTPVVKANNRSLSYLLLVCLTLCFLTSLLFIGLPTKSICLLRQIAFGVIFAVCVSCILAKTVVVFIAFNAKRPTSKLRKYVGSRWLPISIVFFGFLFQLIICTVWLSTATPYAQKNMESEAGKIVYECNEGSVVMFYLMLGYLGLLASVCFVLAFLARNLPDTFNEAKYITFSMLVFISVWLSFIPAYLSTKGKYMAAVEIFAILVSSAGLLICIFIPKCCTVLLTPAINTKRKLTMRQ